VEHSATAVKRGGVKRRVVHNSQSLGFCVANARRTRRAALQDLALIVDGAPQIAHLIQMPAPPRIAAHVRETSLTNLSGEHRAKPVPPEPDGLVADVDPALGQQSSTLRSDSGYRTYIITTRRMTSGELLKYRNGLLMHEANTAGTAREFPLTPPSPRVDTLASTRNDGGWDPSRPQARDGNFD
jgi:hypothetical protein